MDPTTAARTWPIRRHRGTAGDLHDLDLPPLRALHVMEVTGPSLVLGSSQPEESVDRDRAEAAGIRVVRRRSGGGAVLLVPGEHVWVDVVLPAGDPLWVDDVRRSSAWLGVAWSAALAAVLPGGPTGGTTVRSGGVTDPALGALVCFAATGPGEVLVGGRKLVGLSQRRTRTMARLQCVVHRRLDRATTLELVRAGSLAAAAASALDDAATDLDSLGVAPGWSAVEGLRANLP